MQVRRLVFWETPGGIDSSPTGHEYLEVALLLQHGMDCSVYAGGSTMFLTPGLASFKINCFSFSLLLLIVLFQYLVLSKQRAKLKIVDVSTGNSESN